VAVSGLAVNHAPLESVQTGFRRPHGALTVELGVAYTLKHGATAGPQLRIAPWTIRRAKTMGLTLRPLGSHAGQGALSWISDRAKTPLAGDGSSRSSDREPLASATGGQLAARWWIVGRCWRLHRAVVEPTPERTGTA